MKNLVDESALVPDPRVQYLDFLSQHGVLCPPLYRISRFLPADNDHGRIEAEPVSIPAMGMRNSSAFFSFPNEEFPYWEVVIDGPLVCTILR
jgi:hypothetical protein